MTNKELDKINKELAEASSIEKKKTHDRGFDWVYFETIDGKEFIIREHPDGTITKEERS